jgi:hypothetical protein
MSPVVVTINGDRVIDAAADYAHAVFEYEEAKAAAEIASTTYRDATERREEAFNALLRARADLLKASQGVKL